MQPALHSDLCGQSTATWRGNLMPGRAFQRSSFKRAPALPAEIAFRCPQTESVFEGPLKLNSTPGSGQVGFVVDKMALEQVFSEYFGFPCQSSSTSCSKITLIYHLGLYNRPEVAAVPGDVSPTP
jgi:hypothetical protein